MSADTVDDLESAEDAAGTLAAALAAVLADPFDSDARSTARALVSTWGDYCRPTCGFQDDGECMEGDCCGCPCGHEPAESVETAPEIAAGDVAEMPETVLTYSVPVLVHVEGGEVVRVVVDDERATFAGEPDRLPAVERAALSVAEGYAGTAGGTWPGWEFGY